MSKLLKIISAHTGLRAFQEFTDSFHNSFHWLTTDTQGEQTSLTDLVVLTYPGQDRAGKHFGLRLVSPQAPHVSSKEQEKGRTRGSPRRFFPSELRSLQREVVTPGLPRGQSSGEISGDDGQAEGLAHREALHPSERFIHLTNMCWAPIKGHACCRTPRISSSRKQIPALEKTMRCGKFEGEKSTGWETEARPRRSGQEEKVTVKTECGQRGLRQERVHQVPEGI